jgi:tripartite-type tricarboxylate transporter receptor subunit TctC
MRKAVVGCAFGALLAVGAASAQVSAQDFPSRHVTLVVPLATGGSTDTIARIVAEGMRPHLGQTVIVENTPGAGGATGVIRVARSAPDGYTLQIDQWGTNVAAAAVHDLPIDLLKDLEPVALISTQPSLIVGRKDLPANNIKELIAWLKANSGKVSVGTSGPGSPSHVFGSFFQNTIETKFNFIPYRSAGESQKDLVGGQVDMIVDTPSTSGQNVKNGLIKAFVLAGKDRTPVLPDVPTVDEAGLKGMYFYFWHAIWAPKGTPKPIIARLNEAVTKAVADPVTRQRLEKIGQEFFPATMTTPEGLAKFQKEEAEKWWPVIKAQGIKVQ